ncbi:peptidoglycan binding protein CsiV [Vibrio sp. Isolate25]|uniref:peptidoglycan binding protein CsiV n=1 Tax=Vibrio sp. Isolate25 TaxID=2908535 RepID=UPI001EFD9463|nr:peptidoglycan binding protein CsiV [Vibrio sp. Isolate25]MCG9597945.1 peptidoglycan binding protein CsiV [Vibrio sp. Isolate25]
MKKLIPLLLLVVAMPSWAQRQFDIEVIIFKRAVNPEQTAESWPNSLPEISMNKVGNLNDANYRTRKGVELLPASSYKLNSQVQKLKNHAGFKVLLHTAWRQGDGNRHVAPTFHIQAGRDFSGQFNADGSQRYSAGTEVIDGVTEETIAKPLYELDGKLQVYVEHYLYADLKLDLKSPSVREVSFESKPIDLTTTENTLTDEPVQAGLMEDVTPTLHTEEFLKSYRMDQKRRMRSTETHFLDHPLLGMIIQVRRVAQ